MSKRPHLLSKIFFDMEKENIQLLGEIKLMLGMSYNDLEAFHDKLNKVNTNLSEMSVEIETAYKEFVEDNKEELQ